VVSDRAVFLHAAEHTPKVLKALLESTTITPGQLAGCEQLIRHLHELEARHEAATDDAERELARELAADTRTILLARLERERILASRAQREKIIATIVDAAVSAAPLIRGLL
jgi:hypothetical protein